MPHAKAAGRARMPRAQVLDGLQRFHRAYKKAPLSSRDYWEVVKRKRGTKDFPSPRQVGAYFKGMIPAWLAAGIAPDYPKCKNPKCRKPIPVRRIDTPRRWCSKVCAYQTIKRIRRPAFSKQEIDAELVRFNEETGLAPLSGMDYGRRARALGFPAPYQVYFYYPTMILAWVGAGVAPGYPLCSNCSEPIPVTRAESKPKACAKCRPVVLSKAIRASRKASASFTGEFGWIDEALRAAYLNPKAPVTPPIQSEMERRHGFSYKKHKLLRRAYDLGLGSVKEPPWSERELEILREFHYLSPEHIGKRLAAEGYKRTKTAIGLTLKRGGLKEFTDRWNPEMLANMMGIDQHKAASWLDRGLIPWERRFQKMGKDKGGTRAFSEVDLYIFLVSYRQEYDIRKCDQRWLLAMLIDFPVAHAGELAARLAGRGIKLEPEENEYTRYWIKRKTTGPWAGRNHKTTHGGKKARAA